MGDLLSGGNQCNTAGLAKRVPSEHRGANRRKHGITRPAHITNLHTLDWQMPRPTFPLSTDHPVATQRDNNVAAVAVGQ
jgi:hypothetical protein